jgi:hypothetical protein
MLDTRNRASNHWTLNLCPSPSSYLQKCFHSYFWESTPLPLTLNLCPDTQADFLNQNPQTLTLDPLAFYLLSEACNLLLAVLSDVVLLVVHTDDTAVHGEQRPVEPPRHRAIEVLALIFGHLKDHLCRVIDGMLLGDLKEYIKTHRLVFLCTGTC